MAGVVALVTVMAAAGLYFTRPSDRLPPGTIEAIEQAATAGHTDDVFRLVQEANLDLTDARLARVVPRIGSTFTLDTDSPSATVNLRRVSSDDPSELSAVLPLGQTPIVGRAIVAGEYVVDLSGDGHLPVTFLIQVSSGQPLTVHRRLQPSTQEHDRMVFVEAGVAAVPGGDVSTPAFFIDAFEVTNEDFARFLSAGGYANVAFWPDVMVIDGQRVARAEALRRFVDRTNLPGPRSWSGGTFAEGKARHPVTGVSWYEASAFAKWAGKELPAYPQWWRAAVDTASGGLPWGTDARSAAARANFGQAGTVDVGSYPSGVSPFGCFDMAGNVREWLSDVQPGGARHSVTGGSWLDEVYMFEPSHTEWFEPAYANQAIGFRLVTPATAAVGQGAPR